MQRKDVYVGMYSVYGINALYATEPGRYRDKKLIGLSFIERSKTLAKAITSSIAEGVTVTIGNYNLKTKDSRYYAAYKPIPNDRDRFFLVTILNKDIGDKFLVTDEEHKYEDLYNLLMLKYKLPLLKEWMPALLDSLLKERKVSHERFCTWETRNASGLRLPGLSIHGRDIAIGNVLLYDFRALKDGALAETVSNLVQDGIIKVAEKMSEPLVLDSFDSYIKNYGASLVKNLEKQIEPLSPLNGELDGFAAKTKRLFPQQAACINGIIALKKANSQYGLMIEGMGCGKTLQGAAVVDAYFNQEWLRKHKGKDLKDLYKSEDQPVYRNVLMAPSHLISKWKEEIISEIPGTTVHIINDFEQLLPLRNAGKKRTGREWYLISKDFAKLGYQYSPIPTTVAKMVPKGAVCRDCLNDESSAAVVFKQPGESKCSRCGGRKFVPYELPEYGKLKGLVCPDCGNLLIRPVSRYETKGGTERECNMVLTPADFADKGTQNEICTVCGAHLWGVDAKPIGGNAEKSENGRKWYKVSHYKNYQKKNRTTAFVLKGHEREYLFDKVQDDIKRSPREYGPRRYSPSLFIKKYLKGYFDFCILDEAHKYEAGGSAQAIAAHALMKVSDFTLCLTGTITNGKADSLFYLLYMLDPRRMNKRGFKYSDVMAFARRYGCVETVYESNGDVSVKSNSMSRGRQIKAPQIKPGISPLLFTDFLMDKAVFLDLSDLSSYLPPLKEQVAICDMPDDINNSYRGVINALKQRSRQKGGRALLSTMLQFGLSYPDKPYGYKDIQDPKEENSIVVTVPSHNEYAAGNLLPKEKKLIEIVNSEISQDRNCFIYCAYTGSDEMNVTGRLLKLVEDNCNLKGQVFVMGATNPKATKREAFIKKKASEGIRVFICNMKLVETGLDFCFKYEGAEYNYPTIIFYQLTYELAVMWQASRRHYRLNQKEECHTYYLTTGYTLQQAAVQIMAEKQVAASAIQGKFSVDGLASMAAGIDPRLKLAQMLSNEDDGMDRESLENMFDVMNSTDATSDDERYGAYIPPKTFYEIMEGDRAVFEAAAPVTVTEVVSILGETSTVVETESISSIPRKKAKTSGDAMQLSIFGMFGEYKPFAFGDDNEELDTYLSKGKKSKKAELSGQMSLFELVA